MFYTPKKYRYVLVDSQAGDVEALQDLLESYSNYVCVGVARNNDEAVNLILDQLPQLVFFDTELVDGITKCSSFSIIHNLYQYLDSLPEFIAMNTSASHSYQAIKNGVFDYILKPINYYDLRKTLIRFEKKQPDISSICIKSFTEFKFLLTNDIVYLKADNNTTDFFMTDGSVVTSCKTLKIFEDTLPNLFIRIHKSYMVNIAYITKIHFSKFHCSLKFTKNLIPFSKSLTSKMHEIKDLWQSSTFAGFQQQVSIGS